MQFALIDWLVVLAYVIVILAVGLYVVKKPKTSEGYFLAGRQVRWPFIGASYLVSNISAEHYDGAVHSCSCIRKPAYTTGAEGEAGEDYDRLETTW
ncbi:MAG: hypothetical protein HYX78_04915 [Armatimonadetes bacterium]|nr:hypothetical protein [Armatimonadota bacterium]